MPLTMEETIAKADNLIELAGAIRDLVQTAKAAKADGVVDQVEKLAILESVKEVERAASTLALELAEDVID